MGICLSCDASHQTVPHEAVAILPADVKEVVDDAHAVNVSVADGGSDAPPSTLEFDGDAQVSMLKEELEKKAFILLPGSLMKKLLLFYGAKKDDLDALEAGNVHSELPSDPSPSMNFRQIAFHRVVWADEDSTDTGDEYSEDGSILTSPCSPYISSAGFRSEASKINDSIIDEPDAPKLQRSGSRRESFRANTQSITQIPQSEIASGKEGRAKVEVKRDGTRYWPLPPKSYADSSVPEAFAALNQLLSPAAHHEQSNIDHKSKVTINDQIAIRVTRLPESSDAHSPTPEGIHQDNTEISSVTLVRLDGVTEGGESRIWSLDMPPGNYNSTDDIPWEKCMLDHPLRDPWETVYFNDRKVKHEAREFDGKRPCNRDVIVNFIRKPVKDGSDEVQKDDDGAWHATPSIAMSTMMSGEW